MRVVDALLDTSRAESGVLIPDRDDIDLTSVTADLVESYRPATEGRLDLRVDLPTEPLRAYLDRTMWTTIVNNLVDNALKFTPRGEVAVSLSGDDSQVVLTVTDTGVGIAPEEQAQIFQRFHRAANGGHHPGAGIGLSLVAEMTAAHGGSVEVDSEPGVGSQFVVRLPRYDGSPEAAELADSAAEEESLSACAACEKRYSFAQSSSAGSGFPGMALSSVSSQSIPIGLSSSTDQ